MTASSLLQAQQVQVPVQVQSRPIPPPAISVALHHHGSIVRSVGSRLDPCPRSLATCCNPILRKEILLFIANVPPLPVSNVDLKADSIIMTRDSGVKLSEIGTSLHLREIE